MNAISSYAAYSIHSAAYATKSVQQISIHFFKVLYNIFILPPKKFYQMCISYAIMSSLRQSKKDLTKLRSDLFLRMGTNCRRIEVITADGIKLDGVHFPYAQRTNRVMIVMWGIRGSYETGHPKALAMQTLFKMDVVCVNYRGVGQSQGFPYASQDLVKDGEAMVDWARNHLHVTPEHILIYGSSLGGGVGLQVAANKANGMHLLVDRSFMSLDAAIRALAGNRIRDNSWIKGLFSKIAKWGHWSLDSEEALVRMQNTGSTVTIVHHPQDRLILPEASLSRVFRGQSGVQTIQLSGNPISHGDHHTSCLTDESFISEAQRCATIAHQAMGSMEDISAA